MMFIVVVPVVLADDATCPYDVDYKFVLQKALISYLENPQGSVIQKADLIRMLDFYLSHSTITDADCSQGNISSMVSEADEGIPDEVLLALKCSGSNCNLQKCDACADGTACGGANDREQTCKCMDIDGDGRSEFCHLAPVIPVWPACGICPDGTTCGDTNPAGQVCTCKDINNDNNNEYCYLEGLAQPVNQTYRWQTCTACQDGTSCGQTNSNGDKCKCYGQQQDGSYLHCLIQCDSCSDGTQCGDTNSNGDLCRCLSRSYGRRGFRECELICDQCSDGTYCWRRNSQGDRCICTGYYGHGYFDNCNINGNQTTTTGPTTTSSPTTSSPTTSSPTTSSPTTTTTVPVGTCSDGTAVGDCSIWTQQRCEIDPTTGTPVLVNDPTCWSTTTTTISTTTTTLGTTTTTSGTTTTQASTTTTSASTTTTTPSNKIVLTLLFIPVDSGSTTIDLNTFNSFVDNQVSGVIAYTGLNNCAGELNVTKLSQKCQIQMSTDHDTCSQDAANYAATLKQCADNSGEKYDYIIGVFNYALCGGGGAAWSMVPDPETFCADDPNFPNEVIVHELGHQWGLNDEYFDVCRCFSSYKQGTANCLSTSNGGSDPYGNFTSDYCGGGTQCGQWAQPTCLGNLNSKGGRCIMAGYSADPTKFGFCPDCLAHLSTVPQANC